AVHARRSGRRPTGTSLERRSAVRGAECSMLLEPGAEPAAGESRERVAEVRRREVEGARMPVEYSLHARGASNFTLVGSMRQLRQQAHTSDFPSRKMLTTLWALCILCTACRGTASR